MSLVSRPDIAYAVGLVNRYLERHGKPHWQAVKRIFCYLKGTKNYGIMYTNGNGLELLRFLDSDYAEI